MTACRLLVDPPANGAWNMAVDEVLWEWPAESGAWGLRLYRWSEPTLSLGYFQAYEDRRTHGPSATCPVVRRMSGGGAIVHDAELTYALAVPANHRAARLRQRLYEAVHESIVALLAEWGIEGRCHAGPAMSGSAGPPFLCFQRRSPGDVVVGGVKVAGSAQRRSAGAVLQHGSLLLARSPAAPELPGLCELAGRQLDVEQIIAAWLPRLSGRLELDCRDVPLSLEQRQRATRLAADKYGSETWTRRRGR